MELIKLWNSLLQDISDVCIHKAVSMVKKVNLRGANQPRDLDMSVFAYHSLTCLEERHRHIESLLHHCTQA